jgi:hypothetical protein
MFLWRPRRARLRQRLGELAARVGRVDLVVDHADLDGAVHASGDPLMLGGFRSRDPVATDR